MKKRRHVVKTKIVVCFFIAACLASSMAVAVPAGKTLEFTGSSTGKVIFDGTIHSKAVKSCKDCHNSDLFPTMKKGSANITMKDIKEGRYCGVCHNGKVTFSVTENCGRCHKK